MSMPRTRTSLPVLRSEIFDPVSESWDTYRMGDLTIRLRFIPTEMGRLFNKDGTPRLLANGRTPEVQVTGNLTVSVIQDRREED